MIMYMNSLQLMLADILVFIDDYIVPLLISIAVLVFLWNLFRFAILQGLTDEGRERARRHMLWGIIAFVIILGIWSITGILVEVLNVDTNYVEFDYLLERCNDPAHEGQGICQ